jgi:site-specific recombinase XerD
VAGLATPRGRIQKIEHPGHRGRRGWGGNWERYYAHYPGPRARTRRSPDRRQTSLAQAVSEFLAWCEHRRVPSITAVQPVHVAGYIEELTRARSAPTAKQRLSAIRHLFDWLVVGQVMPVNPASSVRGPSHVVKRGKTPVLSPEEARRVLDAIDVGTHAGLRDRALIALMVFSFARIGAAIGMKVEDVFVQNRRLWVRLREKGGKRHEMPCHHNLETDLHAYLDGSGIKSKKTGFANVTVDASEVQVDGDKGTFNLRLRDRTWLSRVLREAIAST